MNETLIKGLIIGIIVGAVAALGLTIGTGVAVLGSKAKEASQSAVQDALVDAYAGICVENFNNAPNFDDALRRLGATPFHARNDFIANGGYATMPGQERQYRDTADQCGRRLTEQHGLARE